MLSPHPPAPPSSLPPLSSLSSSSPSVISLPSLSRLTNKLPPESRYLSRLPYKQLTTSRPRSSCSTWHEIPERELTPAVAREMRALQLRSFARSDGGSGGGGGEAEWGRGGTKGDSGKGVGAEGLPTRFQLGRVVEGGIRPVGGGRECQAAGVPNRRKRQGKSLLDDLLNDDTVQENLKRNYNELEKRAAAAAPNCRRRRRE
eukprot:GHVQ01019137.1.p1 GENE.GHVQ01019137.1~~GHVQ01019137.1.p1  ORF type:complete len:210 (-),score=55.65 GHVQ01019137.1:262-867(-)